MLPLKPDPDASRDQAMRSLARAAIATGRAAIDQGIRADKFIAKAWPDDTDVPLILKASVGPLMREDAAALLQISLAFLQALTPQSAAADLFGRALSVSFGTGFGAITVPSLPIPNADFVAEGAAIPVVEASPASAGTLTAKKLKVITTASAELFANPSAEDLVRAVLVESTGPALDRAVFSTAAATPDRPAGLLHGIAPLTPTGNLTNDLISPPSGRACRTLQ